MVDLEFEDHRGRIKLFCIDSDILNIRYRKSEMVHLKILIEGNEVAEIDGEKIKLKE